MSSNRYVSSHYTQQIHKQPDTVLLRLNVLVNTFARFVHTQEKQRQWASKCALHFVILADPTHYFGAGPTYDVLVREGLCYIFMDPAQWDLLRNVHSVVFQTRILQELGECERKVMLRVLGAVRTIDDEANAMYVRVAVDWWPHDAVLQTKTAWWQRCCCGITCVALMGTAKRATLKVLPRDVLRLLARYVWGTRARQEWHRKFCDFL